MKWKAFISEWQNVIDDVSIRVGFNGDMDQWIVKLYIKGSAVSKVPNGRYRRVYSLESMKSVDKLMDTFAKDCENALIQYGISKEG